jgi:ATP-binding cassette subfamily B protein
MTSSAERGRDGAPLSTRDGLPPALSSMWRLCKLGYRHEPGLMLAAFVLALLAALPDALMALWLMSLGVGVLQGRPGLVLAAAIGLGASATAPWVLRTVSTAFPRQGDHRARVARRAAPGVGGDHRSP